MSYVLKNGQYRKWGCHGLSVTVPTNLSSQYPAVLWEVMGSSGEGVLLELGHWEWALWVSLVLVPASVPHSLSLPSDFYLVHWDKHKRPHAPVTTSQAALLTMPSSPWYAVLSNHESESILRLLGPPFIRYLTWWGEKKLIQTTWAETRGGVPDIAVRMLSKWSLGFRNGEEECGCQGPGRCEQSIKADSCASTEDQAADSPGKGEGSVCQTSEGTDCQQWA